MHEIETMIETGESETVEFKKSTAELEAAFRTVCAFLNGVGGIVVLGVNNAGKVVGQDVADSTKKMIAAYIGKIEPHTQLDITYPKIKGRTIIVIKANAGTRAPYVYDGRPYQRRQSTTVAMPQHRYEELLAARNQINHAWEKCIANKKYEGLLDIELMLGIIRAGVDKKRLPESALREKPKKLLERLNLIDDSKMINAAVALFGTKFMPDYPQCQLKLAHFKGTTRKEFLDNNIIYGNVFHLLDEAMFFVRRNVPIAAKIENGKLERTETPPIPFTAIREAMINALCHRDYSSTGGSIGLAIYDDRMEIFNSGGLMQGMTIKQIKSGISRQRNPIIADVFYKCNMIEKYGRGIQEIIDECVSAGVPEPTFTSDNLEFKVTFKFATSIGRANQLQKSDLTKLSARQATILEIVKIAQNITTQEILTKLSELPIEAKQELARLKKHGFVPVNRQRNGLSIRNVQRDLAKLRQLGLIELRRSGTDSSWVISKG